MIKNIGVIFGYARSTIQVKENALWLCPRSRLKSESSEGEWFVAVSAIQAGK